MKRYILSFILNHRAVRVIRYVLLFFPGLLFFFSQNSSAQAPADPSSIIGKVVCGYQGWFTATGDGSPINRWTHWSPTTAPKPGVAPNPNPNLTFDVYPDVSVYNSTALFNTGFAAQGNGNASKLYSAYKQEVTDKQFQVMQANGIDGVAFQRFIWEVLVDPAFKANRDTVAVHVRKAAEKYSRMFYLVYDLSGLGNVSAANDQARFDAIKADWTNNMIGNLAFTSSPMYARQGGKPVVQIWGIGYNHIIGTVGIQKDLIDWFKQQGCYVIAGVPTGWRTNTGASMPAWTTAYLSADMISPWMVGAFADAAGANSFKTSVMAADLSYCTTNNMAYQPVIFPGFSWYNWNSGTKNQIPRAKGTFMWTQARNIRALGITSAEIAMFDEYDEGTAIMNMADGYDMIPTNQYFVTSSADGTYLSPDFYLRLARKVTRLVKRVDADTVNITIPYSTGPVFFRTSHETDYDPTLSYNNVAETGTPFTNITASGSSSGSPTCIVSTVTPHRGLNDLRMAGMDGNATTSYAYFKAYDVSIPVTATTELSFWSRPENALGRYVSLDLTMTDGSNLRSTAATDQNGLAMHPASGRGTVGAWTKTTCNIGVWLSGKTIARILIAYDHGAGTGDFSALIDDISINTTAVVLPLTLLSFQAKASYNDALLSWKTSNEINIAKHIVERSADGTSFTSLAAVTPLTEGSTKNYNWTDVNAASFVKGTNTLYYRLRSDDRDGKFTYSNIVPVAFSKATLTIDKVFPNPFKNKISISLQSAKAGIFEIVLNDAAAKSYSRKFYNIQKGASTITLDNLAGLTRGVYFLNMHLDGEVFSYKVVNGE